MTRKLVQGANLLILLFTLLACGQKSPLEKAERIADRIIDETKFETEKVGIEPTDHIQVIDYNIVYDAQIKGTFLAKNIITSPGDTTIWFGISYSMPFLLILNDEIVYEQNSDAEFYFGEKAYGMYDFQDKISLKLKEGENQIIIQALCDGTSLIYLREITHNNSRPLTKFGNDQNKQEWLYINAPPIKSAKSKNSLYKTRIKTDSKEWKKYPNLFCDKLVIDETNTYKRESYIEWHYAIGTTMLGLINLNEELNNPKIEKFVKDYCDFNLAMRDTFQDQYNEKHALRVASYRNLRKAMLDDTGPATIPYTYLYQKSKESRYLPIIREMVDYISNDQSRLEDGTFCRPEPAENTIWADDLYMSCQLLLRAYLIENDTKYLDDVIKQIKNFDKHLWDDSKQLFKHARMGDKEEKSEIYWGRANGWINWTLSDALMIIPTEYPGYEIVLEIYKKVIVGITKYQSNSGLWHQVLDRDDSFKETSSSAMFTLAIARGVLNGWLSKNYEKYAIKGWKGISENITDDGIVKDICRGTGIGHTFEFYNNRDRFNNDPRGLGAVLTSAVEVSKLAK